MRKRERMPSEPKFEHIEPIAGDLRSDDPDTLLHTHEKLQNAVSQVQTKVSVGNVLLDLSKCEEIDPGGLLLTMYAFEQISRTKGLSLWFRGSGDVGAYLIENIDHFWERRPERVDETSDDFLLRRIKTTEEMVEDITQYADGLKKASYGSHRDVALWETQVAELTTNGFQHGTALETDRKNGEPVMNMVAGKAYRERNKVDMGVLDFGAGIPRVIEQVAPEEIRKGGDGRLISHALKQGVTSRTVLQNQGAGLHGIVHTIKENGGRLLILSGNGLVYVKNNRINSRRLPVLGKHPTLAGTLAVIILNLQGRDSSS